MALQRIQIPSPNHSGNRPSSRLLVVHTSEGATTFRNLGNFLANPSSQVSYQVGFDNTTATQIGEYVAPNLTAWAAMAANSWGPHGCCCTPSGASSGWSRATWLNNDTMLRACGAWLSEEAARYRVPLVKINADDIRAGRSGLCGHGDVSAAGAGGSHTDPGPNFPWDVVIAYATGGAVAPPQPEPPPPPPQEAPMPAIVDRGHQQHVFDVTTDGRLTHRWYDQGAPASGWPSEILARGLEPTRGPAAEMVGTQLHVFAPRPDGFMFHGWQDEGHPWGTEILPA